MITINSFPKCKECGSDLVPLFRKELDEESKANIESMWWRCSNCEKTVE